MSSRHHHNQPHSLSSNIPRSAVSAALLSYYRQRVQMVKGRCSAGKKKKERERTRKGREKGRSTWSLCCSSLALLSPRLALFLQQSAARNKAYNFITLSPFCFCPTLDCPESEENGVSAEICLLLGANCSVTSSRGKKGYNLRRARSAEHGKKAW